MVASKYVALLETLPVGTYTIRSAIDYLGLEQENPVGAALVRAAKQLGMFTKQGHRVFFVVAPSIKPIQPRQPTIPAPASEVPPVPKPPRGVPPPSPPDIVLANDVQEILSDQRTGPTEKASLVNARVGQGPFRSAVLKRWDQRCAVTGSMTHEAIRASHIKPWRESTNEQRLDPNNGLPLLASFDALSDAGLISFDASGTLIVSSELNASEQQIFGLSGRRLRKMPSAATVEFLAYHRKHVFRK